MKTKSHVRFLSRAAHLDADIELADILRISISEGALTTGSSPYLFDQINPQQHPRLAARSNNSQNRKIAINHLKATLCASFIKDIYEDSMLYFSEILEAAARHGLDPNRLIGEHNISIEANEILSAGSWHNVVHLVSQSVFRRLEKEQNTKKLIEKMNIKLALGVSRSTIQAALPYFEIRHLLVHKDGRADQKFCDTFPEFSASPGRKLGLDYSVLQNARASTFALINEFDSQIISNNVVASSELQG